MHGFDYPIVGLFLANWPFGPQGKKPGPKSGF